MSKASGLILVLAGIGAAAYIVSSGVDFEEQASSRPLQEEISRNTPASITVAVAKGTQERASERAKPQPAAAPPPPPAPKPTTAAPAPAWSPPVVVTLPTRASEPAARMPVGAPPRAASIPNDRASLARELQKELRRVGCYDGEINGAWTTSTRRSMKVFTDRVNATLPIDEPDYILLSLVQGHQDKVCGKPCPGGQAINEDGRCMPSAIMAQAGRKTAPPVARIAPPAEKPTPAITGWSTTATAVAPSLPTPPGEGRMALAGPKSEQKPPLADDRGRVAAIAPAAPVVPNEPPAVRQYGPVPPVGVYDRRPRYNPPRQARRATWGRATFRRLDTLNP